MYAKRSNWVGREVPNNFILQERKASGEYLGMDEEKHDKPQELYLALWVEGFPDNSRRRPSSTGICIRSQFGIEWINRYGTSNSLFLPWRVLVFLEKIIEETGYLNDDIVDGCWKLSSRDDEVEEVFRYLIDDAYSRFEIFVGLDKGIVDAIRKEVLSFAPSVSEIRRWAEIFRRNKVVITAEDIEREIRLGVLEPDESLAEIIKNNGLIPSTTLQQTLPNFAKK